MPGAWQARTLARTCVFNEAVRHVETSVGRLRSTSTAALREPPDVEAEDDFRTFRCRDLRIERRVDGLPRPSLEGLKFGTQFTDHMFLAHHDMRDGWAAPRLQPFGCLPIHPAAQVLQYGMSCFEGMKAFCGQDGKAYLFRPDLNLARFHRSSRRLGFADFDPKELLGCLKELIRLDRDWLPQRDGYSLYIRPFMFASSPSLGVSAATSCALSVVCSPVGPYFTTGLRPIRLYLSETHVRAWPGGVGDCKVAPNYGPTVVPQQAAAEQYGAAQVLYTLPRSANPEDSTVSEAGAMNIFFLLEKAGGRGLELVTPPLDGTILPGVVRDSILQLVRGWREVEVSERPLTVGEIRQAAAQERLREIFGCGTACTVQPVEALVQAGGGALQTMPTHGPPLSARLHAALSDIQHARVPSPWSVPID